MLEIIFPLAIVILFTYGYNLISEDTHPEQKYSPFTVTHELCEIHAIIGYSPPDQFVEKIMKQKLSEVFKLKAFDDKNDLEDWLKAANDSFLVGVAFHSSFVSVINIIIAVRYFC